MVLGLPIIIDDWILQRKSVITLRYSLENIGFEDEMFQEKENKVSPEVFVGEESISHYKTPRRISASHYR